MTAKKKPIVEMTNMQVLHRMVCGDAPAALIVNGARCLIENFMDADEAHGPKHPYTHDSLQVIWALATKLKRLAAENETLQGKLRRGNRKPAKKSLSEMLKKTPETMPQPQVS